MENEADDKVHEETEEQTLSDIVNDTLAIIENHFEKWLDKDLNRDLQATTVEAS